MAQAARRFWPGAGRSAHRHSGKVVLLTLLASGFFVFVLLTVPAQPTGITYAQDDPAVLAENRIRENLPPAAFSVPFLVSGSGSGEAGSALSRPVFDEILLQEGQLRGDPEVAPYVFTYVHPHLQMEVPSVWSLPDSLRALMNNETPLTYALQWHPDTGGPGARYEAASDAEWQDALTRLLEFEPRPGERPFLRSVSVDARQEGAAWRATSLFVVPALDRERVFADYEEEPARATPVRPLFEELEFHVWDVMERDASRTTWMPLGVGIQSEVERQVAQSAQLIVGSFLVIGVLLYVTLRNWRDFVVSYLTLPLVVLWMTGASRLLGLSYNQFTAMLPVLILALGVDFAIHGVRRYREERATRQPAAALATSIARVGPVLVLAAATTATAFLSNAFSDMVALAHWGLMGAIGIAGALFLAGLFAPALRHLWDRARERRGTIQGRRGGVVARRLREGTLLGRLSAWGARHALIVVLLVAVLTLPAAYVATGITSDFNADDFLSSDSYLLEGSNRMREEFPNEGEPAVLLVEGDVADPRVLGSLLVGFERFQQMGYRPNFDYSLVRVVQTAMQYPDENEARYPDHDGNQIPDHPPDLRALLRRLVEEGVYAPAPPVRSPGFALPLPVPDPTSQEPEPLPPFLVYSPDTVRELVHPDGSGGFDMTVMHFGIPGTDDFRVTPQAQADLEEAASALWALEGDGVQQLTLTGEPYKRYNMVQSITASLQISITLSVIGCFLIVLVALRDLLMALATTLPVVVLVAWLFAFMVTTGMSLNVVTVTVAAMAIGVGIDYSIHITGRFREEIRGGHTPVEAVRRAMDSSGVALLGSATTTVTGFLVLMLAPMPLFATFGLITAAMTAASFLAAAVLLPPLLVLIMGVRGRSAYSSGT